MPLSIDPDATFWASLATDREKSPRPEFLCKFLTVRENLRLRRIYDEATSATSDESHADKVLDGITIGVRGWRNIPGEFSRESLAETLGFVELTELFWLQVTEGRAKAQELFLSASGLRSATAAPAPTAGAESAKTSPVTANHSCSDAHAAATRCVQVA